MGLWIVDMRWIRESKKSGQWVTETPFEVHGDLTGLVGGPRRARVALEDTRKRGSGNGDSRQRRDDRVDECGDTATTIVPRLFEGCTFRLYGSYDKKNGENGGMSKDMVRRLMRLSGAQEVNETGVPGGGVNEENERPRDPANGVEDVDDVHTVDRESTWSTNGMKKSKDPREKFVIFKDTNLFLLSSGG